MAIWGHIPKWLRNFDLKQWFPKWAVPHNPKKKKKAVWEMGVAHTSEPKEQKKIRRVWAEDVAQNSRPNKF